MNATDALVFTIGFNGYQDVYRRNVVSQQPRPERDTPTFFHDLAGLHGHVVERWAEYF